MLPAWPLAPGPLPVWLDSLSTRSSKLAPCHTVGWAQVLLSQETGANTPGPTSPSPSSLETPRPAFLHQEILIKHSPQSTEWIQFVAWVQLWLSSWQVSQICCWTETFCTLSIVAFVWYLPEESFPRTGKSLSCSLNGLSGDTGRD